MPETPKLVDAFIDFLATKQKQKYPNRSTLVESDVFIGQQSPLVHSKAGVKKDEMPGLDDLYSLLGGPDADTQN